MENLSNLLLAVLAFGICTWGLILLIRLLKGMEERKLEIWLDFIKVFLGTFVVGLLGYFAKLSFDNRNLAIMESDQIGQYVEQAMVDDLEVRLRFADYFNTVLPKERTTGWEEYYNELKEEYLKRELNIDSLRIASSSRDSLAEIINSGVAREQDVRQYKKLVERVNQKQTAIKLTEKIEGSKHSGHASIIDPVKDMVTCTGITNNLPVNVSTRLPKGRVYMACRIYAPKSETVTINWRDSNQNVLHSRSYEIARNEDAGYRLSSYKNFPEPGDYSVEVVNGVGSKIGIINFEIDESVQF